MDARPDPFKDLSDAFAGGGGERQELDAPRGEPLTERRVGGARVGEVDLGERHDLRALPERLVITGELAVDGVVILLRLASRLGRKLDEVEEDARALDVAKEPV